MARIYAQAFARSRGELKLLHWRLRLFDIAGAPAADS